WLVGIQSAAGLEAVERSRLGPRALWRLWAAFRERGGGPGGLVRLLQEHGPDVRRLVPAAGEAPPVDPCPRCGAAVGPDGEACPSCGTAMWTCRACEEMAPEGEACPWCGAAPPEWRIPDEAFEARWQEALRRVMEGLAPHQRVALEDVQVAAVAQEGDRLRVRIRGSLAACRLLNGREARQMLEETFGMSLELES
ncbi:zinc ribbon domain-containing protein, partial [Thermoflexus sp.]|uniref:zinc ribbon domain-containing protein n=1 Tax=Thermoflexus sp. TaxID=1969742 RepID=UPI002ADDB40D